MHAYQNGRLSTFIEIKVHIITYAQYCKNEQNRDCIKQGV